VRERGLGDRREIVALHEAAEVPEQRRNVLVGRRDVVGADRVVVVAADPVLLVADRAGDAPVVGVVKQRAVDVEQVIDGEASSPPPPISIARFIASTFPSTSAARRSAPPSVRCAYAARARRLCETATPSMREEATLSERRMLCARASSDASRGAAAVSRPRAFEASATAAPASSSSANERSAIAAGMNTA